jgi:hypothetical protein
MDWKDESSLQELIELREQELASTMLQFPPGAVKLPEPAAPETLK